MAKRKSLNRRLSRYSRSSVGSAILDPNTDVLDLDDEHPYWWKDLENNTIVRPSMGSDTLNQTSRYLDSNSRIETSTVEDRWWDVLKSLNNSKTPMATKDYPKKDETNVATTSESEEDTRIVKRKRTLRSEAVNTRDNAFSNVLDNSETAILTEPVQESTRNSSLHSSVSVEKTFSNAEQLNKSQGSSLNHSLTTDIVKVRPKIFGKKYKDQNTNVFDDILNKDELGSPLKKQSSRISLTKESQTLTNDNPPVTTSSLIVNRTQHDQCTVPAENKNYHSLSSSQSTIVNNNFPHTRDNNKDSTTSDAETTVLKPKSKFLKRHNKISKENLLNNPQLEEEVRNENETNESTRKSVAAEANIFKRPLASAMDNQAEFLQPVSRNITSVDSSDSSNTSQHDDLPKKKSVFLNRSRESRKRNLFLDILQDSDDTSIHEASRSKASVNRSGEKNLVNENSEKTRERQLVSDENSSNSMENALLKYSNPLNEDNDGTINSANKTNSNLSKMPAPETATTSRSGNSEEEQSIDSAVSLIEQSKEKYTSQNNTNVNSEIHSNASSIQKSVSQNEEEYVPEVDKSITNNTRIRSPANIPNDSSQDDEYIAKTQSGTWTRLENKKQRGTTDLESEKDESTLKKHSNNFASVQNKSISPVTDEDQQGQVQNVSKRESEGLDRSQKRSTSAIPNEEALDENDITKRQSRNISKSQKLSLRVVSSSDEEEVDVPKRQSKSLGRSQKRSTSAIPNEEAQDENDITKRQSRNISKSQKLSLRVVSSSDEEEVDVPKRQSKSLGRSQKRSTSAIPNEEAQDENDITKRQSRNIRKSQKLSLRVASSSDEEEVDVAKRQSKSLGRSQKQSTMAVPNEEELDINTDIDDTPKRLSSNSNILKNLSVSITKIQDKRLHSSERQSGLNTVTELEALDNQTSKTPTRKSSRIQKLQSSFTENDVEAERREDTTNMQNRQSDSEAEIQTPSKRQSKRLSRSHKQSALGIADEIESEQHKDTTNMQGMKSGFEPEIQTPSKRQSKRLSRSQKQSTLGIAEDVEAEQSKDTTMQSRMSDSEAEIQTPSKRQKKRLSTSQKQSALDITEEIQSEQHKDTTNMQSRKSGFEPEIQTPSKRQSKRFSRSQKQSALNITEEIESEQHKDTTNMQSRKSGFEPEIQTPSKRQSKRLSRSQKQSALDITEETESEQHKDTTNMQSRKSGFEPEIQTPSKRQSKRLSRSQKQSALDITEETESEQHKDTTNMQSRKSGFGPEIQTPSKRQSKRFSRSQKQSALGIAEEVEAEQSKDTTMQSRKSDSEAEVQTPSKRQSKRFSKSQKQSALNITEEIESEQHKDTTNMQSRKSGFEPEIQTPSKRQSKRSSRLQKQSALGITEEIESEQHKDTTNMQSRKSGFEPEIQTPSKRQSKRLSRSQKQSALGIATEVVSEQDRGTAIELRKELTVVDAAESTTNKSQDDANVRYKTLNNLSKTLKQVNTTPKSTKRLTFNLNNSSAKGNARASNATMDNVRNSIQPCNIMFTNVLQNTDKDAHAVGRRSIANVSRSSRPNVSENRKSPNKATGSVASSRMIISRPATASTSQRNIKDFFQVEKSLPASQVFVDKQKLEEVKMKMEILKKRVLNEMKLSQKYPEPKVLARRLKANNVARTKKSTQTKEINKAFLVNGKVYKVPRLARPKPWITNRLYKFLWKKMNSKYGPNTRVVSEKFVRQLSEITTLIEKRRLYSNYESELLALMKEMARLDIIENRLEFYHFCQDFLPYELRVKMIPMLLPGNKRNIPYDPDKVYEPLLQD